MRSSSSELLLDQQQELRKRKLLELAQPKKQKAPKRTCRQRIWFYTTSFLAMTAVSGGSSLLFLVPLYVDPAISTLAADFAPHPVRCVTTRREDLSGIFNCSWSSCREGCTSDMYFCLHVYVTYSTRPYNATLALATTPQPPTATAMAATTATATGPTATPPEPPDADVDADTEAAVNATLEPEDVTEEAVLLDNIKGCGYPPEVNCTRFTHDYGEPGTAFPCFYSRDNRTVVLTHYDRDRHVTIILHYFAVPFVVTLASSVLLCVMYCECRCRSRHRHRRRSHRRSAVEDASDYSISTRVDVLTPHSEATRPL